MNDDQLKKLWQGQPLRDPAVSTAQLVSAMQKQTTQFRRILDARDIRELIACAVVILIFGIFYFTVYRNPVSRVGTLIVIGGAIFIAGKLVYTRRKTPPAQPGATVIESLHAELNSVRAQSRLLGSVLWWYLLPLAVGELIATWGLGTSLWAAIPVMLVIIAVNAFVYWLNQWARAKQLLPLEAQLKALLHSAETGEPVDDNRMSNLRPIVLSMAAADCVKPIEFKVAFTQIALYGVPGIVGIWFFLMLGLTLRNGDWRVGEGAAQSPASSILAQESNRCSIVSRKLVELFNTGDYAGIYELYNPEMRKAFPAKETAAFYTRLAASYGSIEEIEPSTGHGYGGWPSFRLRCHLGEMTMSLTLDADDRISGIYFQPGSMRLADLGNYATARNFRTFILLLFSWQHLLWGALSLLVGLIYSWLVQKTTERAVGISALGIHLQKGLNLILWSEIKEIRPFRLLNIRSLWLINESGEKTIMPWTGLERQPDLKTAVESSAPANHPIREYLSLLRRT